MRAFFLLPLVAASVSAAVIDRDSLTNNVRGAAAVDVPLAFKRAAVGPAFEVRAAVNQHHHRRGPSGHKQRLVRRRTNNKRCKPKTTTTTSQGPTGTSSSEDGQPPSTQPTQTSTSTSGSTTPTAAPSDDNAWEGSPTKTKTRTKTKHQSTTTTNDWESTSTDSWQTPTDAWQSTPTDSWESTTTSKPHTTSTDDWQESTTDGSGSATTSSTDNGNTSAPTTSSTDDWNQPQSTSSSSDGPSSTSSAPENVPTNGGGEKTGDGALFPISSSNYWTTSGGSTPMQDALKVLAGKLPSVGSAPDGSPAMACNYPAGQIGGSSSGFGFYASGNYGNVDPTQATDVLFSYSVYFDGNFDWVKGGKLPGLYGGATFADAKSCSGGNKKDTCFSARLMWRKDGAGEIYNYLPPSAKNDYCSMPPHSECNPAFGDSVGTGSWTWKKNAWNTIAMRVKLNDAGTNNGLQTIWFNGEQVLHVPNLEIRLSNDIKFQGIMAQTFFGGGDSSYAPPNEEHAWFKDWSLAILN